jgi:hypothetical protein
MEPWTKLIERDIPYLTEEPVYPRRIASLREIMPVKQHASIDLRPSLFPEEYDANPKVHLGYLATVIRSPKAMEGRMIFPFGKWASVCGDFRINDEIYHLDETGEVNVRLQAGDNLFIMNTSGVYHEMFVHMAFDFEENITFRAPLNDEGYEFATIGPFDSKNILKIGYPQNDTLNEPPEYHAIWEIEDESALTPYSRWINPVLPEHMCVDNVYTLSTVKNTIAEYDVPYEYHNMVIANDNCTVIKPFEIGDMELIVDFGRELSGFIAFDIDAPAGVVLDFYMFESMHDGIIENTTGLNNTMRYITAYGRQRYRSFVRHGFRYIMLTVRDMKSPIKIYGIKTYLSTYPVAEVGQFRSSDYLLNRIWEISRDTTRLCMEDTFVDCPAYEQTFWVGDARNEALINYYTFGAYDIVKRCLNLVPKSMYRTALPESQVPSGWQNVLTAWTLFWMNACREYYDFTGDRAFLEGIYPSLAETVKNFTKFINKDGLLEITAWNMLDWAPMDTVDSGVVTHQNALLVKALKDTAYLADQLGKGNDSAMFVRFADYLKDAINRSLWSEDEKAYIDSIHADGQRSKVLSQQTNAIVYLCDCAEGDRKQIIEKYMLDPPEHFVKIGSAFMSFFYFEALLKLNRIDEILDNIRENWGTMLDYGATTCWETFIGWWKGGLTRSHCHAWSAAPGYFLGAYVLGVRPIEPGFSKILIEPQLCDLKWAEGSVPTPKGRVDVSYRDKGDYVDISVEIPEGSTAHIVFPGNKKIRFNGNFVDEGFIDV